MLKLRQEIVQFKRRYGAQEETAPSYHCHDISEKKTMSGLTVPTTERQYQH